MASSLKVEADACRLVARSEARCSVWACSAGGLLRLQSSVQRLHALLAQPALAAEPRLRLRRAAERLEAVLRSAGHDVARGGQGSGTFSFSSSSSFSFSSSSSSLARLASGGGSAAHALVAAAARGQAARRERAGEELWGEKIPWEQFKSSRDSATTQTTLTEDLLAFLAQEHERLSEDMLVGATLLNQASLAISETLAKDASRLKELDGLQNENSMTLKKEKDRITKQTSRTCSFTLITIGICVLVLIVFVWMVMLIRMTSKSK